MDAAFVLTLLVVVQFAAATPTLRPTRIAPGRERMPIDAAAFLTAAGHIVTLPRLTSGDLSSRRRSRASMIETMLPHIFGER